MVAYKLSIQAAQTLDTIYEYSVFQFGEEIADEYFFSLHSTFELLADQPKLGRKFHEFRRHEHREHVFFYKVIDRGIVILHIFHQKENIEEKLPQISEHN